MNQTHSRTDGSPVKTVTIKGQQYPALDSRYDPRQFGAELRKAYPGLVTIPFTIGLDKEDDKVVAPRKWKDDKDGWKDWTVSTYPEGTTHVGIIPASVGFVCIDIDEGGRECAMKLRKLLKCDYPVMPSRSRDAWHMYVPCKDVPRSRTGAKVGWKAAGGGGELVSGTVIFCHWKVVQDYINALDVHRSVPLKMQTIYEALGIESPSENGVPKPQKTRTRKKADANANATHTQQVTESVYSRFVELYGPFTKTGGNTWRGACPVCSPDMSQGDRFRIHQDYSGFYCDKCFPDWSSDATKANRNKAVAALGIPAPFGASKQAFHAWRFARLRKGDLFRANNTWYRYDADEGIWNVDELDAATGAVRDMYPTYAEKYAKGILNYGAADGEGEYLARRLGDLDARNDLVACGGGKVLQIVGKNVHITDAKPGMLLTKKLGAAPDTDAEKMDYWKGLIQDWTGNKESAECLQSVIGLGMFGRATRHKIVLFMEGQTNTGKTTFAEVIKAAFADYGIAADETFSRYNNREKHLRQGSLHGKRLALIPDLGPGQKLDSGMLKTVSGGDSLTGRKLNRDTFDFQPQCLILGASNDLPAPDKTDAALKDRLKVIPFERQFTKGQDMIPGLRTTLKTEYLGTIIEWDILLAAGIHPMVVSLPS
ncbi:MAG: hypothetical protein OXI23_05710, partial [Gemmatimonadota bacterium]|nr:hypothetical protein [Gemmatimonadota bacterium]